MTFVLILTTAGVFVYQQQLTEFERHALRVAHGFVPAQGVGGTLLTSVFLHDGWVHLAANMVYLWLFGSTLEDRVGHGRFLAFYLLCGAAAGVGQLLARPESAVPMVGANGAISGVLSAYFLLFPGSRVLILVPLVARVELLETPAHVFLGLWVVVQLLLGVGLPGGGEVTLPAHAAGVLAGAALVFLFRRPERLRIEWTEK